MKYYNTIVHDKETCTVWMQFEYDSNYRDCDLCPVLLSQDPSFMYRDFPYIDEMVPISKAGKDSYLSKRKAEPEHAFTYEFSCNGLEDMFPCEHVTIDSGEGWIFVRKFSQFALEKGIAPYQPFMVKIGIHYYKSGGYEYPEEWDVDIDFDIKYIEPISEAETLRRWAEWLEIADNHFYQQTKYMRELKELRRTDVDAMYVDRGSYYATGYHDMAFPDGTIFYLRSRHTSYPGLIGKSAHHELFSERDLDSNTDELWKRFVAGAIEKYPVLNENLLEEMRSKKRVRC